jgi:hypothetical protein
MTIDWGRLFARSEWSMLYKTPTAFPAVDALRSRVLTEESSRWFGTAFSVSILARDWQGATRLLGSHLCATDALRVSRSSRMVLTRAILMEGRIAPFAQLGFGQWRVDADLQPILPVETEIAAQLGLGFDINLARHLTMAFETDYTVLYREGRNHALASPRVWSSLAVARLEL